MYFSQDGKLKTELVPIWKVTLDQKHKSDLRRSNDFKAKLEEKRDRDGNVAFEPLCGIKTKEGIYVIKEGHHRLLAYLAMCLPYVFVTYDEGNIHKLKDLIP